MAAQRAGPLWTIGQYLDMERHSTVKHEYHDGYVCAIAGGTQGHSHIAGNVYALVRAGVRGTGCRRVEPGHNDPPIARRLRVRRRRGDV